MEMHIVHKKVGEENFLSVEGGLAVTGFFFEVNDEAVIYVINRSASQIDDSDNPAIAPLVEALKHILNPDDKYDMTGSKFKVNI